jgi:large subunit ribosomal protein L21
MIAVIKTGGKQYLVSPGDKLNIEKLKGEEADKVIDFKEVLLIHDEKKNKTVIGEPFIEKAKVTAKVIEQGKAAKIVIFKYKAKKRYQKKKGHRQPFTKIEIIDIKGI